MKYISRKKKIVVELQDEINYHFVENKKYIKIWSMLRIPVWNRIRGQIYISVRADIATYEF